MASLFSLDFAKICGVGKHEKRSYPLNSPRGVFQLGFSGSEAFWQRSVLGKPAEGYGCGAFIDGARLRGLASDRRDEATAVDDELIRAPKIRAAEHGRSAEAEHRPILEQRIVLLRDLAPDA